MAWQALLTINASSKEREYIGPKAQISYRQRGTTLDLLWLFVDKRCAEGILEYMDETETPLYNSSAMPGNCKTFLEDEDRFTEVLEAVRNERKALEALKSAIEDVWGKEHIHYVMVGHYLIALGPNSNSRQTASAFFTP